MLLFGLTTALTQQREEVLSDTCTLQLLIPVLLMVLIVLAAQSVATRALVSHFCAKSGGLSCPSEVFDFAKGVIIYLFYCLLSCWNKTYGREEQ